MGDPRDVVGIRTPGIPGTGTGPATGSVPVSTRPRRGFPCASRAGNSLCRNKPINQSAFEEAKETLLCFFFRHKHSISIAFLPARLDAADT
ncbi:unnamed protein product [Boreogadus saida]